MNRIRLQKSMKECLQEAFKKNAVISSDGLSDNEFILVDTIESNVRASKRP